MGRINAFQIDFCRIGKATIANTDLQIFPNENVESRSCENFPKTPMKASDTSGGEGVRRQRGPMK